MTVHRLQLPVRTFLLLESQGMKFIQPQTPEVRPHVTENTTTTGVKLFRKTMAVYCHNIQMKHINTTRIAGFRREADENCGLLSYYAASSGNLLPTFRDNL
jgi:hypothetical protein